MLFTILIIILHLTKQNIDYDDLDSVLSKFKDDKILALKNGDDPQL